MKNFWIIKAFFLITLCLLFLLNLHNALAFPKTRGLDATAHIEYINFLQTEKRVPLPYEGWELYQPPLYYLITSLLPSLRLVQIFGLLFWLSLITSTYYFFKKDKLNAFIATLFIANLPVVIYQVPAISNELFSASLIMLSMVYYLKIFLPKPTFKNKIIFGITLSLALISKATAILLIPAILAERLYSTKANFKLIFNNLLTSAVITFVISGWFYLRNIILFKNPFISSPDFPAWSSFGQKVVPRNFYFFTNLKGFINLDFFHSQNYSFLSGTYFSFFYDGHNVIIPPQIMPTMGVVLFLLSIPIFLLILKSFYLALKHKKSSESLFFILYSFFLISSYILYNFKLPYYSTVKGSFLTSLALPFTYFFIKAVENWDKNKRLGVLIYLCFYALVITKHFWVQGWWY